MLLTRTAARNYREPGELKSRQGRPQYIGYLNITLELGTELTSGSDVVCRKP